MVSATTAELLGQLENLLEAQAVAEVQARPAVGAEGRRRLVSADQVSNGDDLGLSGSSLSPASSTAWRIASQSAALHKDAPMVATSHCGHAGCARGTVR